MNQKDAVAIMIRELQRINGSNSNLPKEERQREKLLRTLMTVTLPDQLSDEYYEAEKDYLGYLQKEKTIVSVEKIDEVLVDGIHIYKGDITCLQADAIVNAANEKMLGCFVPGHHCIDNAIHMSAGLGLRCECHRLMLDQKHDEATGGAKITKAYNLPSNYVVHTVGPNVNGQHRLTMEDVAKQLESCYTSILELVEGEKAIKSLVFCSISTGVYGVPIEFASELAIKTIKKYLDNEAHHLEKVIINVFSEEDYNAYKTKASEIREIL